MTSIPKPSGQKVSNEVTMKSSGRRVIIAGASGLLGSALVVALQQRGDEITVISRDPSQSSRVLSSVSHHIAWSDEQALLEAVNGATALVNFSGSNVGEGRWTAARKKDILQSRLNTTRRCVDLCSRVPSAPRVFVSASAIGYYGAHGDEWLDETSAPGTDFLAHVCWQWEQASQAAAPYCRVVNPRIGVVLDTNGGALAKLVIPFRMFVGGSLGSGKQWVPWIHRDDVLRVLIECIDNDSLQGAVNCVAPQPLRMKEFAHCIARALHRPSLFRVPTFALKMLLGEQHILVTAGQRIRPKALTDQGFEFQYSECQNSVNELLFKN